jgi:hypothetical protein
MNGSYLNDISICPVLDYNLIFFNILWNLDVG